MEKIRKKSSGKWAGSVSLWLILCLACLLLLSGCRKKEEVHPTAGEDGVYQIYYLNSTRTGLASVSYQTETAGRAFSSFCRLLKSAMAFLSFNDPSCFKSVYIGWKA